MFYRAGGRNYSYLSLVTAYLSEIGLDHQIHPMFQKDNFHMKFQGHNLNRK